MTSNLLRLKFRTTLLTFPNLLPASSTTSQKPTSIGGPRFWSSVTAFAHNTLAYS